MSLRQPAPVAAADSVDSVAAMRDAEQQLDDVPIALSTVLTINEQASHLQTEGVLSSMIIRHPGARATISFPPIPSDDQGRFVLASWICQASKVQFS